MAERNDNIPALREIAQSHRKVADMAEKWIKKAIKKPGALHRALGVPEGEKIPASKLTKALHSSNPTMRKRANLARTLGKMNK